MTNEEHIEQLKKLRSFHNGSYGRSINKAIEALEQESKIGHWKVVPFNSEHGEYRPNKYACSECGWEIDLCRGLQQDTGHRLFCEHCGAKMVEP